MQHEINDNLPELAYIDNTWNKSPEAPPVIAIKRGEMGYYPIFTRLSADELNASAGVTKTQAMAMHAGSMFGWNLPAAEPDNYKEQQKAQYRYRIKSLGNSSAKFGNCEICNQHVSDTHYQVEERYYEFNSQDVSRQGWTSNKCHNMFGHKECLEKRRRGTFIGEHIGTDNRKYFEYKVT